jgi:hypothetical protein
MPTPSNDTPKPEFAGFKKRLAPYCVPYYLTLAAVLGGITTIFVVLTLIIVLVATNFNVLGLIE